MKYLLYLFLLFHLSLSAQITTFPYLEDFDSDDGSWTTSGTNNSWEWGTPNNDFIDENETCGGNAWVTNLTGSYNNNELSYLESPVFDLSGFSNDPVISFQLIREIEFSSDLAYLEVSTDGVSWSKATDTGSANNWYNNTFNGGWSGNVNWLTASNTLTGLAGENTVYLRFVLETSGFETREGIGIDLFALSEEPLGDVLVIGIAQPENGCDLSDAETIEVAFFNDSASPVGGFQVCFEIDSNAPVCETFTGPIAAGSVGTHIFTAKGDFSTYGIHTVTVSANPGDAITCNNELSESIENLETITTFPHYQDFEAGEANWKSGGFNNSWAFGTPNKFRIKGASSGANAWTTGGLTGEYNKNESSSVTSPCFDFTSIPNDYYVGADIWWESDGGTTGTILQASTDNGDTWTTIGALNEPVNWYNDQLSAFGVTNDVWAGENASGSGEWVFAYHSIPSNFIGESSVRFRFLFEEANFFGQETSTADGFAFDNFFIGPQPSLEVDYCTNPIILDAGKGFTAYAWSNTAMTQTIDATSPGTYTVTVTDVNSNNITYSVEVSNIPLPTAIIEANFQNCGTAILTANDGFTTYTWSTGASTQSIFAGTTQNYIVTVTNAGGCTATDAMFIETAVQPLPTISGDLLICANETTLLTVNSNFGTYKWSNGSTTQTIPAIAGTYTVTVSNGTDCTNSASVEVSANAAPIPTISGDLSYCENDNTVLDAGSGFNSYVWSSGESSQTIIAIAGDYTVTVSNTSNCTGTNSVAVSENASAMPTISGDLSVCPNENTVLDAGLGFNMYAWSSGQSTQTITITAGNYTVTVSNASNCTGTNSVVVSENASVMPTISGDLSVCPNENTVLDAGFGFNTYVWSSGESSQTILATRGLYTVTVSAGASCTGTSSAEISENPAPMPVISGDDALCPNETTVLDVGSSYRSYIWSSGETTQTIEVTAGTYAVTVSDKEGCSGQAEIEIDERDALAVVEGSENFVPYMSPVGMDGFIFTVCGGDLPYDYSIEESGGFVSSEIFYASPNCRKFVIYYVYGTEWSVTIEDGCGDLTYTLDDVRVLYPQIDGFDVTDENCHGDENGSITVNVSGGDTESCGDYTYNWSQASGFTGTTQTISNLASGIYHVTITDCEGDETVSEINITTLGIAQSNGRGRGRGRRGRGRGCPTEAGKTITEVQIIADAGFLSLHPNPFQTSTNIQFLVDETDNVWLSVYSSDGKKIKDLLKGVEVSANEMQSIVFDSEDLHGGVYLLQLRTTKGVFLYEKMIIGQ